MRIFAPREVKGDNAEALKTAEFPMVDRLFDLIARLLMVYTRVFRRQSLYYPEISVIRAYGVDDEKFARIQEFLVRRIAAPLAAVCAAPVALLVLSVPVNLLPGGAWATNVGRLLLTVFTLVEIFLAWWCATLNNRVLNDVRAVLSELDEVRRNHTVDRHVLPSGVEGIRQRRAGAKKALRRRARTLRRNIAKAASRRPGEPGFDKCERLAVWLYWASDDLDDEARIHRAIRACIQLLGHHVGANPWLIPDIARPPVDASVVPPTTSQRVGFALVRTVQAGTVTAAFGVVAALLGLAAKAL